MAGVSATGAYWTLSLLAIAAVVTFMAGVTLGVSTYQNESVSYTTVHENLSQLDERTTQDMRQNNSRVANWSVTTTTVSVGVSAAQTGFEAGYHHPHKVLTAAYSVFFAIPSAVLYALWQRLYWRRVTP